jgi:outer membrane protein OmpA-like peptidoglycan-associated protein
MRKIVLTCLVLMALALPVAHAQYSGSKDAVSIRALFPNYRYQFDNKIQTANFTTGLEFEYGRYLGGPFSLLVPLKLAIAEYPLNGTGNSFNKGIYLGTDALLQMKLFKPTYFIVPSIHAGLGANYEDITKLNFAFPFGAGLDFRLSENTYLNTKVDYRVGFNDNRDNIQAAIGLKFLLGGNGGGQPKVGDRDKDGIKDDVDLCPDQAGTLATSGCPDKDGDGVADGADQCPTEAGSAATFGCPDKDNDGVADKNDLCPDQAGVPALNGCPDTDGDGIADKDDKCPTEKGLANNGGCPVRDADGDGITDDKDECPNAAGPAATKGCPDRDGDGIADKNDACPDVKGPISTNGCPDTDGDGVIDSQDACPNTAGTAANRGCPEITQKDKETLSFAARNVQFQTGSAIIKKESYVIMDQILDILKRYPDYDLRINGHTDATGSADANLKLSQNRARACFDYLVAKGIAPNRITPTGFGKNKPIATNATPEGRTQNRRTEFEIFPKQ